jgi:hypothetical protein
LSPDDEDEKPKAHDVTHTIVGAKRQSRPTGFFFQPLNIQFLFFNFVQWQKKSMRQK